jgi:lipid-A-disaccharide synthase
VHFVCPSIWAWRGGRVKKMAASCDHVLCLFPFEPALLQATAWPPPSSAIRWPTPSRCSAPRAAARQALGLAMADTVVAVLPGSRRSEIQYIAPPFLQAAALLHAAAARAALRAAGGAGPAAAARAAGRRMRRRAAQLLDGQSHAALAACDVT